MPGLTATRTNLPDRAGHRDGAAGYGWSMAQSVARARRPATPAPRRGGGGRSGSSGSPLIARLQSSAGNRAVADLLASDAGRDAIGEDALGIQAAAGNEATSRLLTAQRAPETPKAEAKPDPKAERKAWQEAGLVGGGALYDLINKDLSLEKLVGMALPELAKLATEGAKKGYQKGTEEAGTPGELKPVGLTTEETGKVAGALTGWAQQAADKWLKSDDGKQFLAKAQGVVNQHPKAAYWTIVGVLAAAIGGAVTAYFTNTIDPPEIKKAFEVKGLKIDAAVDLGKFREQVLQSAKLGLSGKAGPGTAAVEGTAKGVKDKEGAEGYEFGATASYTITGEKKDSPSAKFSGGVAHDTLKSQTSANLGASVKFQPLTLDTTWKFAGDGSGVLDTTALARLSQQYTLGGGVSGTVYGPGAEKSPLGYKLSLTSTEGKETDKLTLDLNPTNRSVTFGREATRTLWGGSLTAGETRGTEGKSVSVAYAREALKLDLKYAVDKAGAGTLETSASTKGPGFEAALAGKFGLDEGELQSLTVKLGFNTPDETIKFIHQLSIKVAEGEVEAKAAETIKLRLKQIAVEVEGSVGEKAGQASASARAEVGWKLPPGLILGAGAAASYTPGKEGTTVPWMVGPQVSVGHEALPIRLVGGVSVPVGSGSEGLPPVFGLSIAPNFEFGSGKKK